MTHSLFQTAFKVRPSLYKHYWGGIGISYIINDDIQLQNTFFQEMLHINLRLGYSNPPNAHLTPSKKG